MRHDLIGRGRGGVAARLFIAPSAIAPKTLRHHLPHLRTAGLVFGQRRGKCIRYEAAESRVRYQRQGDAGGKFSLTVTARGSGVAVTLAVGGAGANDGPP